MYSRWALRVFCLVGFSLVVLGVCLSPPCLADPETAAQPVMLAEPTHEGSLKVAPPYGVSGKFGTWTVTYTLGEHGIRQGGGIRVELPDAWHSGPRVSANRLQASDPSDDFFISARSTCPDVKLETIVEGETNRTLVKGLRRSLDARKGRLVFVVRVRLVQGNLQKGDRIEVIYGDRSQGSRGYRAPVISIGSQPVLLAVDSDGTSHFKLHTQRTATLTSVPDVPVELMFHLPTDAVVGQPVVGTLAIIDKWDNPVAVGASIQISRRAGEASIPSSVALHPGQGYAQFRLVPKAAGLIRLHAQADKLGLIAESNPLRAQDAAQRFKVYWGDLHSHTAYSFDGVGNEAFYYARYISGLDFYARTDHTSAPDPDGTTIGLNETTWNAYIAEADKYYDPGHFVTLYAYELSLEVPFGERNNTYGHHNIYFRNRPGLVFYPQTATLPNVWAALTPGEALTIPHHTGKFPNGIVFAPQDETFRRNIEIYSGHGSSEVYDPDGPLAFEKSDFTSPSKSLNYPSYAQDAWKEGLHLSTIASTDDHYSHPGKPHWGAAAVFASSLTRNGIFDALDNRRTYATTGSRIILEFTLNGEPMGGMVPVDSPPQLSVLIVGTDIIGSVELLRYRPGDEHFTVSKRWQPGAMEFAARFVDDEWRDGAVYYVRVTQSNLVRGRPVMAWSSPIWTVKPEQGQVGASKPKSP